MKHAFTMTVEHIALLRAAYVYWERCESGAPCIDPKRPYGNGDVARDVAKIIGEPATGDTYDDMPDEQRARLLRLHRETEEALQIVLVTGSFEPGNYRRTDTHKTRSWVRDES